MSEVKVNKISPRTACGTVTLGDSGDTFTIPSGATITNSGTASGFGATGAVNWITTPKVTGDSPVTGVTGKGYFMNTTAGTITINLPAGAAGSIISVMDYAGTWQTNNLTVSPNGSEKIGGVNAAVVLSTEGQSVTFVYVDSTQGWLNTMDSTSNVRAATFIVATGGTPCSGAIVCTDYKVHTFTGPGTFCVSCAGGPSGSDTVDYMVIAGGGGGQEGAGGAGGYRESPGAASGCYTVSPLGVSPAVALPVSVQGYPIVIGGGGPAAPGAPTAQGGDGVASSFSTITSTGGGGGGKYNPSATNAGRDGGSGGGSAACNSGTLTGGAGNTPPVTPPQGQPGGPTPGYPPDFAGGGGGATAAGTTGDPNGAPGGAGATSSITGTPVGRAGGGGGGISNTGSPSPTYGGGTGGNEPASNSPPTPATVATAGTVNTGGGGGGTWSCNGEAGGSGVVVIRYKFQ